jgi:two-component system, LytTR family, sensor kinase
MKPRPASTGAPGRSRGMRYKTGMTNDTSDAESAVRPDRRTALLSILGFWLFYFGLNTLRWAVEGATHQLAMIERRSVVTLFGVGFTYLLYLLLRRFERSSIRTLVTIAFLASVPVSVAYAAVNYAAFNLAAPHDTALEEVSGAPEKHYSAVIAISDSAIEWYFFIASWAVLYVALTYAARVRHAERSSARYRAEAQAAQLRALRYQINPHFLFNTLNSLSTLVLRARNDEAERMITNLSAFFRASLTADPTEDVPLAEEIRMQQLYLDIEQIRFPQRLKAEFDIAPAVAGALVPGLILQPLVENAIKYGVSRTSRPVTLAVRAHGENGRLHLSVEDDGEAEGEAGPVNGHGVGLRNVCDRLATRFDGAAECRYGPRPEGGFRVDLTLPWL